jgi:hypothetical protein
VVLGVDRAGVYRVVGALGSSAVVTLPGESRGVPALVRHVVHTEADEAEIAGDRELLQRLHELLREVELVLDPRA